MLLTSLSIGAPFEAISVFELESDLLAPERINEPRHEKTCRRALQPSQTNLAVQTQII